MEIALLHVSRFTDWAIDITKFVELGLAKFEAIPLGRLLLGLTGQINTLVAGALDASFRRIDSSGDRGKNERRLVQYLIVRQLRASVNKRTRRVRFSNF